MTNVISPLFPLEPGHELMFPHNLADLDPGAPATAVFTDFKVHPPTLLYLDDHLEEARSLLEHAHRLVLAVVDRHGHFRGLLTRDQLGEEAVMRLVAQGQRRTDLQVRDLMMPRAQLVAMDYVTLSGMSTGKLVTLLHREGRSHILVVDRYSRQVRGLISAAELAHRLRLPLEVSQTPTFLDIFEAVMH